MSTWKRAIAAAMSVLLAAGIGFLTNIVTQRWTLALGVGLVLLVVVVCVTQVYLTIADGKGSDSRQHVHATGGSVVVQAGRDVVNTGDLRPEKPGDNDG